MCQRSSIPSRIRRLVRLSSTTRTFTSRKSSGGATVPTLISFASAAPSRKVKWNWLPRPTSLSTHILPPIICTRRVEMVSPNPVPPYFRVVEVSAWENGLKINSRLSSGIPTPVSATVNRQTQSAPSLVSTWTFTAISPLSVNLMALPTRLITIWRSRLESPRTISGTSGATSHSNSSPFSSARTANVFSVDSKLSRRLKSSASRSIFPASIFEKSRMSLITVSRESPDIFTVSRYSRCSGVSSVSSARSVIPITPFSGVRISWLMLAKNSLFARLAASAASRAVFISSCTFFR